MKHSINGGLGRFVACFWTLSSGGAAAPAECGTVLPDGSVEIVLSFGEPVRRDGQLVRRMAVGQLERQTRIDYTGLVDLLGVRLRPAALGPLLGVPASELTGRVVPLSDVTRRLDERLAKEINPGWNKARRLEAITSVLEDQAASGDAGDGPVESAVEVMEARQGRLSVSRLMAEFGLSARQLERRFQRAVGVGPKTLCRILRFQSVVQSLDCGRECEWAALAAAHGYCDQSHLIREFRDLAGVTPAEYVRERAGVSEMSNTAAAE